MTPEAAIVRERAVGANVAVARTAGRCGLQDGRVTERTSRVASSAVQRARSSREVRNQEVGGQALDARVAWVAEVGGSDAAQDVRTAPGPEKTHTAACREQTPSPAAQMSRTLPAESTEPSEGPWDGGRTLRRNPGPTSTSADPGRVGRVAVGVDIGGLAGQAEASAGAQLRDDAPLRVAEQDRCSDRVEGGARGHLLHRVDGRRGALIDQRQSEPSDASANSPRARTSDQGTRRRRS